MDGVMMNPLSATLPALLHGISNAFDIFTAIVFVKVARFLQSHVSFVKRLESRVTYYIRRRTSVGVIKNAADCCQLLKSIELRHHCQQTSGY